jgi:transposase
LTGNISFDFVREKLKDSYSDTGRPSIDPELLLRILLIGYLYGVTSERKLVEELQMHLAWRWFTGLSFDQEIPHHSTFSKNRHGRFLESNLFQQLFEEIVDRCMEAGLVEGEHLSVDGSFIPANASRLSRIPREQLPEAAHVKRTVREYLADPEQENPVEEPAPQQDQVSTTDPDSTYSTKGDRPAELGYFNNYLIDNKSCVILGVQATTARLEHLSATFNPSFPALKPSTCATANFTLTGASDGDTLALGVPNARTTGGGTIADFAWVSAADTVTIQGCNISASPQKTAGSGAIRVDLWKH